MFKLWASLFKCTAGFAREELILAAAVGGTLSTFGVVGAMNMGWVGTGTTSEVQVVDALQAVESANLKFYQRYGVWPDEASDGTPTGNVAVLVSRQADVQGVLQGKGFSPLIQADLDATARGLVVRYRAAGGAALAQVSLPAGTSYRYMVSLERLTLAQARKIDEKIDGEFNPAQGRVRISYGASGKEASVKYYVNPRGSEFASR